MEGSVLKMDTTGTHSSMYNSKCNLKIIIAKLDFNVAGFSLVSLTQTRSNQVIIHFRPISY